VSLSAESVDFLEDAAVDLLILTALGWNAVQRARVGMALAGIPLMPGRMPSTRPAPSCWPATGRPKGAWRAAFLSARNGALPTSPPSRRGWRRPSCGARRSRI
jgi:hypothetical protein